MNYIAGSIYFSPIRRSFNWTKLGTCFVQLRGIFSSRSLSISLLTSYPCYHLYLGYYLNATRHFSVAFEKAPVASGDRHYALLAAISLP